MRLPPPTHPFTPPHATHTRTTITSPTHPPTHPRIAHTHTLVVAWRLRATDLGRRASRVVGPEGLHSSSGITDCVWSDAGRGNACVLDRPTANSQSPGHTHSICICVCIHRALAQTCSSLSIHSCLCPSLLGLSSVSHENLCDLSLLRTSLVSHNNGRHCDFQDPFPSR